MSDTAKSDPKSFFGSSAFQIVAFLVVFSLTCWPWPKPSHSSEE